MSEHSLTPKTPSGRLRVAVFASGNGSNFQAMIDACKRGFLNLELALLVCDKPQAYAIERANQAGIPVYSYLVKEFAGREAADLAIIDQLRANNIEWVVLAGYMRLLSSALVQAYANRIVNVHPSLLPAFPGLDAIGQALRYGVRYSGVTVHLVDEGLDSGPIIGQQVVTLEVNDTEETLAKKIHAAEHELYPRVLKWIAEGRLRLEGRICHIEEQSPGDELQ